MDLFDRELMERHPTKLLYGGLLVLGALEGAGLAAGAIHVVFGGATVDWRGVAASLAILAAAGLLAAGVFRDLETDGPPANLSAFLGVLLLLLTAHAGVAGLALGNSVLVVLFMAMAMIGVGVIGDGLFVVVGWVLVSVFSAACFAAIGDQSSPAALAVAGAVVYAGIAASVGSMVRFFAQNVHLSELQREFERIADESSSYLEALEGGLRIIGDHGATESVVVLVGSTANGFVPRITYPDPEMDAAGLADHPSLHVAANSNRPVEDGGVVFLPAGLVEEGLVLVAARRSSTGILATIAELPYDEMSRTLSAMSLRFLYLAELRSLSSRDPLTGLFNRRVLMERVTEEVALAADVGRPFSVAMIDLDRFKDYNDDFGHQAGDDLLRLAARLLDQRTRRQDTVGRYGGEEFLLAMPDTDLDGAVELLEELQRLLREVPAPRPVTFSAGVSRWDGEESIDQLIARADDALYEAKRHGRDRVRA